MRARITLSFVATLVIALLATSAVSLLLVRHASSIDAQRRVLAQARVIEQHHQVVTTPGVLSLIHGIADINSESVIVLSSKGRLLSSPPPNIPSSNIDLTALAHNKVISGAHSHFAFAAVPVLTVPAIGKTPKRIVALVFESKENFSVANVLYFALAGFVTLIVAAGFSIEITRRITRHLAAAVDAAKKIADGDLSARIDVPGRGYPELRALQDALNMMAYDLERSQHAERQFLLSISHELRTPLTSIRGYAEAISEGAVPSTETAAHVVISEADRLSRLIDDLLSMARLSAHQFALRVQECDLTMTAASAAEALRYACEQAGVALLVATPTSHLFGLNDADRVSQIIANLVENALKYARSCVDVTITQTDDHELLVDIGDDGPGIDPQDIDRVFDRLFTSDRHATRKIGTGLGLAIVSELSGALGGKVTITSPRSADGGTIFHLQLPSSAPTAPTELLTRRS